MSEIICPHCNKAFTIDESDYAKLMKKRFQNGEISEEEYTEFLEKMRKERKQ